MSTISDLNIKIRTFERANAALVDSINQFLINGGTNEDQMKFSNLQQAAISAVGEAETSVGSFRDIARTLSTATPVATTG